MSQKIRFAIIGCGGVTQKSFLPALAKSSCAEIGIVASRSLDKAQAAAKPYEAEAMEGYSKAIQSEDIDAVYIATPTAFHAPLTTIAAEAGKHVLCEKSMAMNYQEAQDMVAICQKNNVALMEGFMYQHHSQHQTLKQKIAEGFIGTPQYLQASFGFPPLHPDSFRYQKDLGGGALLDAGAYTLHAARNFFGKEPLHMQSYSQRGETGVEIQGSHLLDFGNGQTASLVYGFNLSYRNQYSIWGSEGQITLKRSFSIPPDLEPTMILEQQGLYEEVKLPAMDQFKKEIEVFCEGIQNSASHKQWMDDALNQSINLEKMRVRQ